MKRPCLRCEATLGWTNRGRYCTQTCEKADFDMMQAAMLQRLGIGSNRGYVRPAARDVQHRHTKTVVDVADPFEKPASA